LKLVPNTDLSVFVEHKLSDQFALLLVEAIAPKIAADDLGKPITVKEQEKG